VRLRFRFLICAALLLMATASLALGARGAYQTAKDGKTTVWNNNPRPGEAAEWSGARDHEGYATGFGTLTWFNAKGTVYARYYGNMVQGKFDGPVNVHSKGKTGHALFVAGGRTTPWATGPAPSRMAVPEKAAENPPSAAAKTSGAASAERGTVRAGRAPNIERATEKPEGAKPEVSAATKAENVERPTSNIERPITEAREAEPQAPAKEMKPEREPAARSQRSEVSAATKGENPPSAAAETPGAASENVRDQVAQRLTTETATEESSAAEPPAEKAPARTKTKKEAERALLAPGEVRPIEHIVRKPETIHEETSKRARSANTEHTPSVEARSSEPPAASSATSAKKEISPSIEPTPIAAAIAPEVIRKPVASEPAETPKVEESTLERSNSIGSVATPAPAQNATTNKEVDDSLKSLVAPPAALRNTPAPSPSETPE
jgi:hypothetical protein